MLKIEGSVLYGPCLSMCLRDSQSAKGMVFFFCMRGDANAHSFPHTAQE